MSTVSSRSFPQSPEGIGLDPHDPRNSSLRGAGTRRLRRLRQTALVREALAETRIHASQLIQPHFVMEGNGEQPLDSLPGISRLGGHSLVDRVKADCDLGVATVLLFGVTDHKDGDASAATDPDGLIPRAVRQLRAALGDRITIITDVCLCGATDHGHCGVLANGRVLNDESLPLISQMALVHAHAGADIVAPSDMMDFRVAAIREALDRDGLTETAILSYSTKFASAFYGPFRDAADSAPKTGDRKSYQLDPRNGRQALDESLVDAEEGADYLMVKPALAYLDLITQLRARTLRPIAAYNVSGEYSMVKAAAERGWISERAIATEILTGIARAGADLIITYHAREALAGRWLE